MKVVQWNTTECSYDSNVHMDIDESPQFQIYIKQAKWHE